MQEASLLALPGELFLRLLKCLSMPLVLPKLVTAIGSMDSKLGGIILAKVLLFYGCLNILIEATGLLVFISIKPYEESESNATNFNKTSLPMSVAVKDLSYNLVPENIFTAPFRRVQTEIIEESEDLNFHSKETENINILGLVAASTAIGITIAHVGEQAAPLLQFFSSLSLVTNMMMEKVIKWCCPPGLMFLIASQILIVPDPLKTLNTLVWFVVTMVTGRISLTILSNNFDTRRHSIGNLLLPGLILPLLIFLLNRTNPFRFFINMNKALLVNFGTASSISTYPVTLSCLTDKNNVDEKVSYMQKQSKSLLTNICRKPV